MATYNRPMVEFDTLDQVRDHIERTLFAAVDNPKHGWHWPALGTVALDGDAAEVRTVVLRHVDAEPLTLVTHTDLRSSKIDQLRRRPVLTWLFYDGEERVQLRAKGVVEVHHDDATTAAAWDGLDPGQRAIYCIEPDPGDKAEGPTTGLPDGLRLDTAEAEQVAAGYAHFAVLRCPVQRMTWLRIERAGFRRAGFDAGPGGFTGRWLVP